MNEQPHKVLKRLEIMAKEESLPYIGPVKGKVIEHVIQNYKPRRILEIGIQIFQRSKSFKKIPL